MVFCECFRASTAAIALKSVAVLAEFLAAGTAVVTGHREPCLSSAIGSEWSCEGSLRAIALSSALPLVSAGGGAS